MHVLTDASVTFSETVLIELPLALYSTDPGEVWKNVCVLDHWSLLLA